MSNKTSDKNVVNDIKILNKFCEYEDAVVLTEDAVVLTEDALEEVQDALQNILAEREQDKKRIKELEEELEKANKQIDLMARAIDNYDSQLEINTFKDKEHVKQYFADKAKMSQ